MKIAIQLFSVRDFLEKDFKKCLVELKQMGYDGVELAGTYGYSYDEISDMKDKAGISVISAHVGTDVIDTDSEIHGYASLGVRYLGIQGFGLKPDRDSISWCSNELARLGAIAKNHGISLVYHNHRYEFNKLDNEFLIDLMYNQVSPELLKTEIDVAWASVMGAKPEEYLLKYADRAPVIHLKDYIGEYGQDSFALRSVGEGKLNIPKIIDSCKKINTEWIIVEQDTPTDGLTSMQCAQKSINYLNSLNIKKY